jgi:hypothetical protein
MYRLGPVSRRALLAAVVTAALLVTTVGTSVALTPYPSNHVVQLTPGGFTSDGDPVGDWTWLRGAYTQKATYTFPGFNPSVLTHSQKLAIMFAPLVTNKASGGAGWGARIHVTVTYTPTAGGGAHSWNYHVTLNNPFPLQSSLDSSPGGAGYQTYGKLTLTKSQFTHGAGALVIKVSRDSSYTKYGFHPHVAVNAAAVSAWYIVP